MGVTAYLSKVLAVAPISFPISGTASGRTYPTPLGGVGHNADFLLGGQHYTSERHLLYVACTRARDHLLVTGVEPASEFLDDLLAEF